MKWSKHLFLRCNFLLPYDSLQSDVTSADSVQLTVNFSYDGYPMRTSEGAAEACLEAYTALGHTSLKINIFIEYIHECKYNKKYEKLEILFR